MTEREYITTLKRAYGKKVFKVRNSYGIEDAVKYYRLNNGSLERKTFKRVIQAINKNIQEQLSLGNDIYLPCNMGILQLRKYNTSVGFVDGKVRSTYPIDWDATNKLWYRDEDARNRKILVRAEVPSVYKVLYKKTYASFKNKQFYKFTVCRALKRLIKSNVQEGRTDAFLLYNK